MGMAKRQGREKPAKIEQRKLRGPEWGPQIELTALLSTPIYLAQAQGEEKTYKKTRQRAGGLSPACACTLSLFSSHLLGRNALTPWGCIFLYFLNKTDQSKNYNTDCPRAVTCRGLKVCHFKFLLKQDRTEEITLPWHNHAYFSFFP